MGENTKIEWADHSWNPWLGCAKVSPACTNCYAEGWAKRSGLVQWGPLAERRVTSDQNWKKPLKWNKEAGEQGVRRRVFCASLADVFDDHVTISQLWRDGLYDLILETKNLDWLLLTKRPQNVLEMIPESWCDGLPENIWIGTTVESQGHADVRIPHLLKIPAKVRFLSCEPLLGPIEFSDVTNRVDAVSQWGKKALNGIHWVIAGGESGPNARPSHPAWFRSLRNQCNAVGVPFFFKQHGEWLGSWHESAVGDAWRDRKDAHYFDDGSRVIALRKGKKYAGRLLDGREWNEVPA